MTETTHRRVASNGISMHVAEAGEGPLVVLCHGFPELWYSWRHQFPALVGAGYHVVAPDQRGYGETDRPDEIAAYDIEQLSADILGLVDALGSERAVLVGHDWGSPVVFHTALRAPERVAGVVGMSVPYLQRPHASPVAIWRELFADTFFYILYFQEPGVADAELGRDPRTTLRRLLYAVSGDRQPDGVGFAGEKDGRGMVERMPEPRSLPSWLTQSDLDYYVAAFTRTGFTGGLNWYRNFDRNWELTADLHGASVTVPAAFIAGAADPVLAMSPPDRMARYAPDLRATTIVEGAGHWVQQERPEEVNRALLAFLASLHRPW